MTAPRPYPPGVAAYLRRQTVNLVTVLAMLAGTGAVTLFFAAPARASDGQLPPEWGAVGIAAILVVGIALLGSRALKREPSRRFAPDPMSEPHGDVPWTGRE